MWCDGNLDRYKKMVPSVIFSKEDCIIGIIQNEFNVFLMYSCSSHDMRRR